MSVFRASVLSVAAVGAIAFAVTAPVMTAPVSNADDGSGTSQTTTPLPPCPDGHPWDDCH